MNGGGTPIRRVRARGGAELPALGLGTYRMGEDRAERANEVAALRLGLDLGMTLIDTAEMYADGGAEEVTGEAVKGRRDDVFIVTKVLPHNASRQGTIEAAERSLRRLGTDRIDLYLLHWQGPYPLQETFDAFARLARRGSLSEVARRHGTTEECIALAWTLHHRWVVSIPKSSTLDHVRTNHKAISLTLSGEDLADLDRRLSGSRLSARRGGRSCKRAIKG